MSDDPKKSVTDSLRDWGIDVEKFAERSKESMEAARGDLSEITGTLRATLVEAKDVLIGLQKSRGGPAAAELKSGFERAWAEIERAFSAARQKAKEAAAADQSAPPPTEEKPTEEKPPEEPPM